MAIVYTFDLYCWKSVRCCWRLVTCYARAGHIFNVIEISPLQNSGAQISVRYWQWCMHTCTYTQQRASDRWADLYVDCWWMVTFATFKNGYNFTIYQPNVTSLASKWKRHPLAFYDMLLIVLIWNISWKLDF